MLAQMLTRKYKQASNARKIRFTVASFTHLKSILGWHRWMADIKMAIVGCEIQALRDDATQQFTNSDWHHCALQYSTEQMANTAQDVYILDDNRESQPTKTPRAKSGQSGMYSTEDWQRLTDTIEFHTSLVRKCEHLDCKNLGSPDDGCSVPYAIGYGRCNVYRIKCLFFRKPRC